jgi:FMN phosphatase YigB (HAD superfamily)
MKTAVRASEIATLLDDVPPDVRCLSLDCFDTLLWRNTHEPVDVFADISVQGGAIDVRRAAETHARLNRKHLDGRDEVSIETIYDFMLPHLGAEARAAAVAAEIAAEVRHCYAFAPTVALIRAAKAKGLRVIIVSDTYLSSAQLRDLITAVAGDEVSAMIDDIFASSEYGVTKGQGLFKPVLAALKLAPSAIVHLGDNYNADAKAPRLHGMNGVHFEQFSQQNEQRLRLEATAAAMIDPTVRVTRPVLQPHRPSVSLYQGRSAAASLGHDVLGPIMDALAHWVHREVEALAARTGRRVKPLFLLRDGHLPQRAYEAAGYPDSAAVAISRFTANAASFRDVDSVRALLAEESIQCHKALGRQLLLRDEEIAQLGKDRASFCKAVIAPRWIERIRARSEAFSERLIAHVRNQGGVEPGDAIMLVDLGYNGTVQNVIGPILEAGLNAYVAGRYLLLRETFQTGRDKAGLLDTRFYETRLLNALCRQIAVIEQLATAAEGSVIDYRDNGDPARKAIDVKGAQSKVRDEIQDACLSYVREADVGFHRRPASHDSEALSRTAGAILARLLFLPQSEEVALLREFDHDINLGTNQTVKLIDGVAADDGLRRRGLPYLSEIERIYLPGELQPHGLALGLSLFAVGRFGFDLRHSDFRVGGIEIPLLIADARGQTATTAQAYPTHDGYYTLAAPAGSGSFAIGVQLGAIAECVQIEEVGFYPVGDFTDISATPVGRAGPIFDAMEQIMAGLYRCAENGLVFVPPPAGVGDDPLVLVITFRPVVRRAVANSHQLREAA